MAAHYDPFFVRERAGFVQDGVGNADFADIVQQGRQAEQVKLLFWLFEYAGRGLSQQDYAVSVIISTLVMN